MKACQANQSWQPPPVVPPEVFRLSAFQHFGPFSPSSRFFILYPLSFILSPMVAFTADASNRT
jgi:hypothetical protein